MRDAQPQTIYLKDYREPDYWIDRTELTFRLEEEGTWVSSRLQLRRNAAALADAPLVLHGQQLELVSLAIDGQALAVADYQVEEEQLTLAGPLPSTFELQVETRIEPHNNTSLEGLYKSSGMFCTQCEAEGFRKITYYLDRPDVMSAFRVRIEADAQRYPVLLSNGNCIEQGPLGEGRHYTVWEDPFRKPAYLFALVAGDLALQEDHFTTMSGRVVTLRIFVEPKDLDKLDHAMDSLKRSMRWDEEVYGREYDLEIFNIVAVDDFNMGAMENKSLNIFNTSCVLAHPETTTDAGFQRVEAVVAHEYFHNWSGNRVTCRDWFQLSLKEGFTVYRDACFSADMNSATVKRVEDVQLLRTQQFAEDAGPMAHPIRPDSFIEISNFYTLTVYEKGAEVVRMLANLLGAELFRAGCDRYFERFDGQAVTCDDFVACMAEVSGRDFSQFMHWYTQAGTPQLSVTSCWDEERGALTLTFRQSCPPSPGQPVKQPYLIPVAMGLLGEAGALRLQLEGEPPYGESSDNTWRVLEIDQAEQSFTFIGLPERPVPSLLRGFSAPVKLDYPYLDEELVVLMSRDEDGFVRWDACQALATRLIESAVQAQQHGTALPDPSRLVEALATLLADDRLDPAMVALMLHLPSEAYLHERAAVADVAAIHQARHWLKGVIAERLAESFMALYHDLRQRQRPYAPTAEQIALRSLKNAALMYWVDGGDAQAGEQAWQQFVEADNQTDRLAALTILVNSPFQARAEQALADFYQRFEQEALVVNQWFQVQATADRPDALERVEALLQHPAFTLKNPNRVRSLIAAFGNGNPVNFHRADGAGYRFLADQVIALNGINPQIASRLLTPLTRWRKHPAHAAQRMREQLERLRALPDLSRDLYEVVSKSLAD